MAFTPSQQEAIDHDGHLLIVAGPGSGKTTTSVAKALRILADPTRQLMMVTFTREGADEMRRRLDAAQTKAGGKPFSQDRLLIGTFHSIALRHLFKHRPKIKVLSPGQQGTLLRDALAPFGLDRDAEKDIRQEFESYMYAIDRESAKVSKTTREVIERYMDRLKGSRSTDLFTVMRDCALLCDKGDIPTLPYSDMLVDEGQDTDQLQKTWIFAHARFGVNVTIVGDDDQSIYEWRNALGYAGMKSFQDTFHAKRVELGDNFRCREEILSHAVILVQHNTKRMDKNLVARRGKGGCIAAYHTTSIDTQCRELAEFISETPDIHTNSVVLARKNSSLGKLEFKLTALGVPYVRIGPSIWDNPWVITYLGLLQSLVDCSPVGIFGCLDTIGLDDAVKTELLHALKGKADEFVAGVVPNLEKATETDVRLIKEFANACKFWRIQLLAGSVNEVTLDTGEWLSTRKIQKRVKEVIEISAEILSKLNGTLPSRLLYISQNRKSVGEAPVTLMTMHGSKGLEFETVHVIDAGKPDDGSTLVNEEAERRLMYVALTRSKNQCFVWYSGEPHPTLAEAHLPVAHNFQELREVAA